MPPVDTISSIHQQAMTGRQVGSSPHDLLKREPFPFRKETSHTKWDIAFQVLLEKCTEETTTVI